MGAWISFIATIETYMKMQLSKLKLAAMASHNQVNKKDFSNSKTQPKGRGGHKRKEPKQTGKPKSACVRCG